MDTRPTSYNAKDANDILRYAQWLIGKTFQDILDTETEAIVEGYNENNEMPLLFSDLELEYGNKKRKGGLGNLVEEKYFNQKSRPESKPDFPEAKVKSDSEKEYGNKKRKGGLGNLVEEHYFHYKANSDSKPDFPDAGLELKVTPYEKHTSKKGQITYSAGERLVLSMISYNERPIEFDLFKSHLWKKCSRILLITYMRNKDLGNNLKYRIDFVNIFTPSNDDIIIIKKDYEYIINKIFHGKAHELSEGDTMYLGACTKGKNAAESVVVQVTGGIGAKSRAFCYKTSYMTMLVRAQLGISQKNVGKIVSNPKQIIKLSFEELIQQRISKHINSTDKQLCKKFGLSYTNNKAQWITLAYRMLGIKSNKADEFLKANIVVKCVRIEEDGHIVENSPLPAFRFKDLVRESWVDYSENENGQTEVDYPSTLQSYLTETKFFFVMFQNNGNSYVLRGAKLWNMPLNDINGSVKEGWTAIRNTLINGVKFTIKDVKEGKRTGSKTVSNNFPSQKDNEIIHIRPHAQKAYYKLEDGQEWGKPSDGDELPDGRWMTKQSFWLNNSYLETILGLRLL